MNVVSELPQNMQAKIQLELCPIAGLDGDCWTWTGCLNSKGYGCVGINKKVYLSHRAAYEHLAGPIPKGFQIDHLCENKRCCNPDHLEPVTDAINKSRTIAARKTMCVNGHPLSGDNLLVKTRTDGRVMRNCRQCRNDRSRERYYRRMAVTA